MYDGAGAPIPDAVVEIWGADEDGVVSRELGAFRRDDHTFTGFGRAATTDVGRYEFWTRNPGPVDGKAPFFSVIVFARGLPDKLVTRIYLPEHEDLLAADALLSSLAPGGARYAHRNAHPRRVPAARHPAAGREGDRLPCLLTHRPTSRSRSPIPARVGRPGDVGLLSPVSIGAGDAASDRVVVAHLIEAELALTRALVAQGLAPASADRRSDAVRLVAPEIDLAQLAQDSVAGGNPVIPLIPLIRARVAEEDPDAAAWVHTRRDEPGHPRLRADDARPRRGGVGRRRTCGSPQPALAALARGSPRRPGAGPHAHPARRADDPRR